MRQNLIYVVVGQIGSGKSDNMKNTVRKILNNSPSINKLVVFDDGDYENWQNMKTYNFPEGMHKNIPIIKEENLLRLKSGYVRVIQQNEEVKSYIEMFSQLKNAVVVIEDATRSFPAEERVPKPLRKLFINVKQRNIELFMAFHSLAEVPAWIARNCRVIILHHVQDPAVPSKLSNPMIKKAFAALKDSPKYKDKFSNIHIPVNVNITT